MKYGFHRVDLPLVSSAVGGKAAGTAMEDYSLVTVGNSIVRIIGEGTGGGQLLFMLTSDSKPGVDWILVRSSIQSREAVSEEASSWQLSA